MGGTLPWRSRSARSPGGLARAAQCRCHGPGKCANSLDSLTARPGVPPESSGRGSPLPARPWPGLRSGMGTMGDHRAPDARFEGKIARENGRVEGDVRSLGARPDVPAG